MKKIEAIIRIEKLEELREALEADGFVGMTITEVKGRGKQKGIKLEWRVGEYTVEFLPKIKLEMVVSDDKLETAISTIETVCSTGTMGDGKMFISNVEQVIKLSTKERGSIAV